MVYKEEHMLLQWSGHFAPSPDRIVDDFSGGLRFVGPALGDVDNKDVAEDLWNVLSAFWKHPASGIPGAARLDALKWNRIDVNGRYKSRVQTTLHMPDEFTNGTTTTVYPTQVAYATTWMTDFRRGLAKQGRTYWPTAWPISNSTGLRVRPEYAETMGQWAMDLIAALNQAARGDGVRAPNPTNLPSAGGGTAMVAAVMSKEREGATNVITGVRVGDRLDIQRRRGDRIEEEYVSYSWRP